ncbi:MAG: hypothetical protein A4E63_00208 [Syntrophorhabdus sp. PtaU1.Bin050]|nr:MAG: hypothetical protein A4E63_00208 [Syntrophorhabdus sp. PtaU1.Bin050]
MDIGDGITRMGCNAQEAHHLSCMGDGYDARSPQSFLLAARNKGDIGIRGEGGTVKRFPCQRHVLDI